MNGVVVVGNHTLIKFMFQIQWVTYSSYFYQVS